MKLKDAYSLEGKLMTNLDSTFKSRDITLPTKVRLVKAECRRIDVFELWCWRRLLDCKEVQLVHSEGAQPWDFFGKNDAEAETSLLWPPDVKNLLIGKTLRLGKVGGEGDDRG